MIDCTTKRCNKCGVEKSVQEFHRYVSNSDGYRGTCKACRKKYDKRNPYNPKPHINKRCSTCRLEYPSTNEYFYRVSTNSDGLSGVCKTCRDASRGRFVRTVYSNKGIPEGTKRCVKCNVVYLLTDNAFTKDKQKSDGLMSICRNCNVKKATEWGKNNPERVRASARRSHKRHRPQYQIAWQRYSARKHSLPDNFTNSDWQCALDYFNGCCAVCGRPPGLWHTIAADHWIPLTSPDCPGTIPNNIVPLCHGIDGCNNSKAGKDAKDWLELRYSKRKINEILKRIDSYFKTITK